MRNLSLLQVTSKKLNHLKEAQFPININICCIQEAVEFYFCAGNLSVSNISIDSNEKVQWTRDLSELVSTENEPVNITFINLINIISIGFANGELVTLNNYDDNYDLVGVCENGLLAMEWSPDQELLALVTKDLKMILMSCTFEPITEQCLINEEFGEKQFINVGWGKKETQFHGLEGKNARVKTEVVLGNDIDIGNKVLISWRGDGELYAVGFTMDGVRRFKVFDKEGNLQYTSEKQPLLEANLAWRPSGNLIATTQKLQNKTIVAFFEKNGLKHGSFEIPIDSNTYVQKLLWSSDSEILSVLCKNELNRTEEILLYTTGNHHWYLKQTLVFKENLSKVMWDNDFNVANSKKLHIILENGQYHSYTWVWNVDHSFGVTEEDDAVLAVIDGNKILLTDFRHAVVPPPLSTYHVKLGENVNSVVFFPGESINCNSIAVVTDTKLVVLDQSARNPSEYTIIKEMDFEENEFPFQHYNWLWLDENTYICTKVNDDNVYEVIQYQEYNKKIIKQQTLTVYLAITRAVSNPLLQPMAFLQLTSGEILVYNKGAITPHNISFPEACVKFSVTYVKDAIYFLGLSHKGNLYLMDKLIMNNVSSYFVHTSFLLITTLNHELICIKTCQFGEDRLELCDQLDAVGLYRRKIERGSKLLIVIPKSTIAIFQLPRGNLEGIKPRVLVLQHIGEYLDKQNYYKAFNIMRKNRINLNLIFDHDPELFIKNIDTFLQSIQNNSWLNLFLTDLEGTDVTKTMYASSYSGKNVNKHYANKVHFICDKIREHLNAAPNKANRILPLLTTYVKKNTIIDLEQALLVIKELKILESSGVKIPVTSDEALKYLLYMVNVDQLFDVALGTYDFELVLLVAGKSQKDPKEYIPMLNELNELEGNYKMFSIDKYLKRFDKAVTCLARCGESKYEELRTFVKYHSLYREALALFSTRDYIYKQISDDFGLYLKLKKQYVEAGIVYEIAKNNDKAIECYVDALEWELALKLAYNKPKEEFEALCWHLASMLKEEKRYDEAIRLLEQAVDDHVEIITFAIKCGQYKTALQLCAKYKKAEVIDNVLETALFEDFENVQYILNLNSDNFTKYKNRLQVVRETKSKKLVEGYESQGNQDSDLYSDAGSTVASSSGSGRSFRSSKNRRKHERKMASLKEGSQYEDTALIQVLHALVTSTFDLRLHVKELNIALCCLGANDKAISLQKYLAKLLKDMQDSFKQIWTNEFVLEAVKAAIEAENVPEGTSMIPQGMATLEPHLRIAPVVQEVSWKLEGFSY